MAMDKLCIVSKSRLAGTRHLGLPSSILGTKMHNSYDGY